MCQIIDVTPMGLNCNRILFIFIQGYPQYNFFFVVVLFWKVRVWAMNKMAFFVFQ